MEALWEAGEHSGRRLTVAEQISVARELSAHRLRDVTADDISGIFGRLRLNAPSALYTRSVVQRLRRVRPARTLRDILVDYRQFAIRELSGLFGGKTQGREEELRNYLLTFLPSRGFTEARS